MLGNSPSFYVQSSCLSFASCRCSVAKVYGIYVTYVSFSCLYCSFLSSGLLSHGLESCSDVSAFCWSAFLSSMYMLIPDILIKRLHPVHVIWRPTSIESIAIFDWFFFLQITGMCSSLCLPCTAAQAQDSQNSHGFITWHHSSSYISL